MDNEYYFYIANKILEIPTSSKRDIPIIFRIKRDFIFQFGFSDRNEAEGPFCSILELKKKSSIFKSIKLDKHKQRVLKNKNIKEIADFILTEAETEYEITFISKTISGVTVKFIINENGKILTFYPEI